MGLLTRVQDSDGESLFFNSTRLSNFNSIRLSKLGPRIGERQNTQQTNVSEGGHLAALTNVQLDVEDLNTDVLDSSGIATFYNNFSFKKKRVSHIGRGKVTRVVY